MLSRLLTEDQANDRRPSSICLACQVLAEPNRLIPSKSILGPCNCGRLTERHVFHDSAPANDCKGGIMEGSVHIMSANTNSGAPHATRKLLCR